MYQIIIDDYLYKKWNIINETKLLDLDIVSLNPIKLKLFHEDTFTINIEIIDSPTRKNKYIAGILDLSKTYGKDNKMLYLCKPDNKHLPYFLIPYSIPPSYDKTKKHLYITFEFKNWNNIHPYGNITQNIGCINMPENFYEYMIYCKNINVSIQPFTKKVIQQINKNENDTQYKFMKYMNRTDKVFTIDAIDSIDLDDGISIKDDVISIYITHVPIIIDYLNLWDSFTSRVSTIYLPNQKKSMLPSNLSQMCSLNEKEERVCLIMDINIKDNKFTNNTLSIGKVKIYKNYRYEEDRLLLNKDYNKIKEICGVNNSHDVIEYLMVYFNQECAKKMSNGIFKSYVENGIHPIEKFTYKITEYTHVKTDYAQFTSPIRRLVDILNIIQLSKDINRDTDLTHNAYLFYNDWYSKINYINESMRNIRKAQNKCKLLDMFNKCSHQVFKGIVIGNKLNMNKYDIYLPELKIITNYTCEKMELNDEFYFKIYVFNNEGEFKKKIKIINESSANIPLVKL